VEAARERNQRRYEALVADAQESYDAQVASARAEYRAALKEADDAGSSQKKARLRREAREEFQKTKREHREEYRSECGAAEELLLQAQVITFPAFDPVEVNGAAGLLAASASSGLDVTYVVDTPDTCEIAGTDVLGLAVGTCTITASQAGDTVTWSPATDVSQSAEVTEWMPPLAG